jgi:hypothetical protein
MNERRVDLVDLGLPFRERLVVLPHQLDLAVDKLAAIRGNKSTGSIINESRVNPRRVTEVKEVLCASRGVGIDWPWSA